MRLVLSLNEAALCGGDYSEDSDVGNARVSQATRLNENGARKMGKLCDCRFVRSVPAEDTLTPRVQVRDEQDDHEEDDLEQQQVPLIARAGLDDRREDRRPGVEEDDFNVDDQEDHRDDVEADVETLACV